MNDVETRCVICGTDEPTDGGWTLHHDRPAHVECLDVRLFTYGTLRKGEPLDGELPTGAVRVGGIHLDGAVLYEHPVGDYPVMRLTPDNPALAVEGELVFVPVDNAKGRDELEGLLWMESRAGFAVEEVVVTDGKRSWTALTLVWPETEKVGKPIAGGDWIAHRWATGAKTAPPRPSASPFTDFVPPPPLPLTGNRLGVLWRKTTPKPAVWVVRIDEKEVWEGSSLSALTRWAKDNDVKIIRAEDYMSAKDVT